MEEILHQAEHLEKDYDWFPSAAPEKKRLLRECWQSNEGL
jgi:hypothetical protein